MMLMMSSTLVAIGLAAACHATSGATCQKYELLDMFAIVRAISLLLLLLLSVCLSARLAVCLLFTLHPFVPVAPVDALAIKGHCIYEIRSGHCICEALLYLLTDVAFVVPHSHPHFHRTFFRIT